MRKLPLGAALAALVLLQPTLALAQRVSPPVVKTQGDVSPTPPTQQKPGEVSPTPPTQQKPGEVSPTPPTQQKPGEVSPTPPTQQKPGEVSPVPPTGQKGQVSPTAPVTTVFPEVPLSQAVAVTAPTRCFAGGPNGAVATATAPLQFVGNVLCIDAGPNGDFASFASNCPAGSTAVVQSVMLTKTIPFIPKCPDLFPGNGVGGPQVFVQAPQTTGIRTFFPLKFTPCNTLFELELTFACVTGIGPSRSSILQVRKNIFPFRVTVPGADLCPIIQALHNEPLGLTEVPCITDEAVFQTLLQLATAIKTGATKGTAGILGVNQALDQLETFIVANCTMILSTALVQTDKTGKVTQIQPTAAVFPNGLPGNFTVQSRGFGIVDTIENPCCCKLIADIFCLKAALIGNTTKQG